MKRLLSTVLLIASVIACTPIEVPKGEPFLLQEGQFNYVSAGITIEVVDIDDQRCSLFQNCDEPGQAIVQLLVSHAGEHLVTLALDGDSKDSAQVKIKDLVISLNDVTSPWAPTGNGFPFFARQVELEVNWAGGGLRDVNWILESYQQFDDITLFDVNEANITVFFDSETDPEYYLDGVATFKLYCQTMTQRFVTEADSELQFDNDVVTLDVNSPERECWDDPNQLDLINKLFRLPLIYEIQDNELIIYPMRIGPHFKWTFVQSNQQIGN